MRKDRDLPGSWGTPVIDMLCSPTPQSHLHQTHTIQTMQPSNQKTMSASESVSFRGSITQPVNTLCTLRSYSHLQPRNTRFRLAVNLCRAGISPTGSLVKFQLSVHRQPPNQPSFGWRTFRGNVFCFWSRMTAPGPGYVITVDMHSILNH